MDFQRNIEVRTTEVFRRWLEGLRDGVTRALIARRLARVAQGNFGNTRSVGEGVFELKIDFGPGYRVYYVRRGETLVVLLCGGDKSTQARDITRARELAKEMES